MLEKLDKILNFKVVKYLLLARIILIPNALIISKYNISFFHILIMNLSFSLGVEFFKIAFKNIFKESL